MPSHHTRAQTIQLIITLDTNVCEPGSPISRVPGSARDATMPTEATDPLSFNTNNTPGHTHALTVDPTRSPLLEESVEERTRSPVAPTTPGRRTSSWRPSSRFSADDEPDLLRMEDERDEDAALGVVMDALNMTEEPEGEGDAFTFADRVGGQDSFESNVLTPEEEVRSLPVV